MTRADLDVLDLDLGAARLVDEMERDARGTAALYRAATAPRRGLVHTVALWAVAFIGAALAAVGVWRSR